MHTYIHAYIRSYLPRHLPTYTRTSMHPSIHTSIHEGMHALHYIALHYATLHYITLITPHHSTVHYITLRYVTFRYDISIVQHTSWKWFFFVEIWGEHFSPYQFKGHQMLSSSSRFSNQRRKEKDAKKQRIRIWQRTNQPGEALVGLWYIYIYKSM